MIDAAEELAALLLARGTPATEEAIRAALRPPRAPDLDRELAAGYLAACARWGRDPVAGAGANEYEDAGETRRV